MHPVNHAIYVRKSMAFPEGIPSISVIQNADYLSPQQKRDILYNNAARFLRLDLRETK